MDELDGVSKMNYLSKLMRFLMDIDMFNSFGISFITMKW